MYLHITFNDGSNPYVAFGSEKEIKKELKRWTKNYEVIRKTEEQGTGINCLLAVPKLPSLF